METARLVDLVPVDESAVEEGGRHLSMAIRPICTNGGQSVVISNFRAVASFVFATFQCKKP